MGQSENETNTKNNQAESPTGLTETTLKIAILLYDKVTALDAVGPYEVLSRLPQAKVYFGGETTGLKQTDSKMLKLYADYALGEIINPDVLLIPGGDPSEVMKSEAVLNWVQTAHKTTKYTVSVCTGAMILGSAGLLKGQKATTHWVTAELLPKFGAEYVPKRYVQTGKIITAAGVSAGIDAGLYLANQIAGTRTAKMIQLAIEYHPQPPFEAGSPAKAGKETVADALAYFSARRAGKGAAK